MKIRPVRAELFHAERRTDRRTDRHDEVNSCFSQLLKRASRVNRPCPRRDSKSAIRSIEHPLTYALDTRPLGSSAEYTRALHDYKHINKNNILKAI